MKKTYRICILMIMISILAFNLSVNGINLDQVIVTVTSTTLTTITNWITIKSTITSTIIQEETTLTLIATRELTVIYTVTLTSTLFVTRTNLTPVASPTTYPTASVDYGLHIALLIMLLIGLGTIGSIVSIMKRRRKEDRQIYGPSFTSEKVVNKNKIAHSKRIPSQCPNCGEELGTVPYEPSITWIRCNNCGHTIEVEED